MPGLRTQVLNGSEPVRSPVPVRRSKKEAKEAEFPILLMDAETGEVDKFTCVSCKLGHRAPQCGAETHTFDPNRLYVRRPKPGRPSKQCPHVGNNNCRCITHREKACQMTPEILALLQQGQIVRVHMFENKDKLREHIQRTARNNNAASGLVPTAAWNMQGANAPQGPFGGMGMPQAAQQYPVPASTMPGNGMLYQGPYLEENSGFMSEVQMGNGLDAHMRQTLANSSGNTSGLDMPMDNETQMGTFSPADMANFNRAQTGNFMQAGSANNNEDQVVFFSPVGFANDTAAHPGNGFMANTANDSDAHPGNPFAAGPSSNSGAGQVNNFEVTPGAIAWNLDRHDSFEQDSAGNSGGFPQTQDPVQGQDQDFGLEAYDELRQYNDGDGNFADLFPSLRGW